MAFFPILGYLVSNLDSHLFSSDEKLLASVILHTETSRIMTSKLNRIWEKTFRKLRPWESKPERDTPDVFNQERILVKEFYGAKNLGREAGGIERAEIGFVSISCSQKNIWQNGKPI